MKKSTLVSTILFLCAVFCAVMLLWIGASAVHVQYEYCCAAEFQRQEDLNPFKASFEKKSWDERSQEVKSEFAERNVALRIVSGNADKTISVLLITALAVGLIASITGLIFISSIASKKAKAKAKAIAKAKAEAEARAMAEAESAAYKARMRNFLLYNRI